MRIPIGTTPTSLVAAAQAQVDASITGAFALDDGEPYAVQNIGEARVYYVYAADEPNNTRSGYTHYLDPGDFLYVEIATATPPWMWSKDHAPSEVGISASA